MRRRTSTAPPVIYLVGSTGHPNYGDELVAAGWLRHLAQTLPEAEVWLDSPRPGQAAALLDGIHPGLRCVDTLFHACWNAPDDDPEATIAFGRQVVNDPGLLPREASAVESLARVDLVHLIGGGYLNGLWPKHLALLGAALGMAERYRTRTVLTGAGLLPLVDGSQAALTRTLSRFDLVDVRDEPSHAVLHPAVPRATLTSDDAVMSLGAPGMFGREGAARTMLCLQSDLLGIPVEQLVGFVLETLRAWGVDGEPVTLVECLPPDDSFLAEQLRPGLPKLSVLPFSRLWRSGFPAGPGQRWITTRFHAHLVAAAAGAWGVAVPVSDDYYRVKHESLLRLGSGWALADDLATPAPAGTAPSSPFSGALPQLRAAKRKVADQITTLTRAGR